MIELFAGSAAITLAIAQKHMLDRYVIADLLRPLTDIWQEILRRPAKLSEAYSALWHSQLIGDPAKRYNEVRAQFNEDQDPAKLLFLLARCVKNAVRFSTGGQFNQSPDRRRRGMRPGTMDQEIHAASRLLRGKCQVICGDFREILRTANRDDLIYMDPPYQGSSEGRDRRYIKGVQRDEMVEAIEDLNNRGIEYILSYDGNCGGKSYGEPLPDHLNARRIMLEVGRSSQATLNGRDHVTVESVYLSPNLNRSGIPAKIPLKAFSPQIALFS